MPRPKDPNSTRSKAEAARAAKQRERELSEQRAAEARELAELKAENERLKAQQSAPVQQFPQAQPEAQPIQDDDVMDLSDLLDMEEEELAPIQPTETPQEPAPEPVFDPAPEPEPVADNASDEEPGKAESMGAAYTSDWVIMLLNKANIFLGEIVYDKVAFAPKEAVWLKYFAEKAAHTAKKGKVSFDMSDEEIEVLHAYGKAEEFRKRAPFNTEEKEMLRKPLVKMFEESGKTISAQKAFIIALIVIMTARVVPVYFAYKERKDRENRAPEQQSDPETEAEEVEVEEVS